MDDIPLCHNINSRVEILVPQMVPLSLETRAGYFSRYSNKYYQTFFFFTFKDQ